jgi:hypothetical protein
MITVVPEVYTRASSVREGKEEGAEEEERVVVDGRRKVVYGRRVVCGKSKRDAVKQQKKKRPCVEVQET